ncbi:enoyl-CoA hydratase-related protein [Sphingobium xenophagum]
MCVGGGCELALSHDMTVASEQSSFALPEVKRGFVATGVRTRIGQ